MGAFRIPAVLSCREALMRLLLSVIAFLYALMLFVILPLPPVRAPYNLTIIYYTPKFDQAVPRYVDSIPFVPSDPSDLPTFLVQPIFSPCLFSATKVMDDHSGQLKHSLHALSLSPRQIRVQLSCISCSLCITIPQLIYIFFVNQASGPSFVQHCMSILKARYLLSH